MTINIGSIPRNFEARDYQLGVLSALDQGYKKVLWVVHRRAGKDITAVNYVVKQMYQKPGTYYYIFPTYSQAKKVIWDAMRNDGFRIIDHFPQELMESKNSQEMKIRFKNKSLFQLVGSDNFDSLMGTNPKGVVFSEYALQDPRAYEFIKPILTANKGWALFISTPRGKNHLWDLFNIAKKNSEWWYEVLTVKDTGIITEEEIEKDRRDGMSEEIIQQEYYCSFDRGIDGSYYGRLMSSLRLKNQIKSVPTDSYLQVHTAWDLGFGDSTAIWFYQIAGNEIHMIDYYQNHGEGIAHYAGIMNQKQRENSWIYGQHFAPHDAGSGSFETGMSKARYAADLGIKFTILPRESIDSGIERVRRNLPKCWFDEKNCEYGLRCIENYRKKYNEALRCYGENPLHDQWSDGADAFRYLCQAVESIQNSLGLTLDEYRAMKQKAFGYTTNSILGN